MARLQGLPKRLAAAPRAVGYSDRQAAERARNRARASGNSLRRLYSTKRWRDLRYVIAERANWTSQGCGVPHLLNEVRHHPDSLTVDHIEPHRGNLVLFWDESNLQAVCKAWHDREKQRQEKAARPDGKGGGVGLIPQTPAAANPHIPTRGDFFPMNDEFQPDDAPRDLLGDPVDQNRECWGRPGFEKTNEKQ